MAKIEPQHKELTLILTNNNRADPRFLAFHYLAIQAPIWTEKPGQRVLIGMGVCYKG